MTLHNTTSHTITDLIPAQKYFINVYVQNGTNVLRPYRKINVTTLDDGKSFTPLLGYCCVMNKNGHLKKVLHYVRLTNRVSPTNRVDFTLAVAMTPMANVMGRATTTLHTPALGIDSGPQQLQAKTEAMSMS